MPSRRVTLLWFGLFCSLAVAFSWPLPLHLSTHLTGAPSGDTGVYVWNLWVFRHEILQQHVPLQTNAVLSLSPPVDLTLHNYTLFMNVLAFPLIGPLGLLGAFNVVYLAMMALTAWCTARLAYVLCGRGWEAWLAGVAFAFSPVLMARSTAHFSLVAAAPLPGHAADHGAWRGQGTRTRCGRARRHARLGRVQRHLLRGLRRHADRGVCDRRRHHRLA